MKATELDKKIGASIAAHRKWAQISRADLARQIGVTHQQLYKYEKGQNRTSVNILLKIADVFKINYTRLIPTNTDKIEVLPPKALELALAITNLSPAHHALLLKLTQQLGSSWKNNTSHS